MSTANISGGTMTTEQLAALDSRELEKMAEALRDQGKYNDNLITDQRARLDSYARLRNYRALGQWAAALAQTAQAAEKHNAALDQLLVELGRRRK